MFFDPLYMRQIACDIARCTRTFPAFLCRRRALRACLSCELLSPALKPPPSISLQSEWVGWVGSNSGLISTKCREACIGAFVKKGLSALSQPQNSQ